MNNIRMTYRFTGSVFTSPSPIKRRSPQDTSPSVKQKSLEMLCSYIYKLPYNKQVHVLLFPFQSICFPEGKVDVQVRWAVELNRL